MIEIGIAYPTDPIYEDISKFAREVYGERLHATINATPDIFAYAENNEDLIGCIGLYPGTKYPELLFEMCDPPHAYKRLANINNPDRALLGEIGTRVVTKTGPEHKSLDISVALTGALILTAHERQIQYLGFVTNRMVRHITKPLGLELIHLGEPDFSHKTDVFKRNMDGFLKVRQFCAGFKIDTTTTCIQALERLKKQGFMCINSTHKERA